MTLRQGIEQETGKKKENEINYSVSRISNNVY